MNSNTQDTSLYTCPLCKGNEVSVQFTTKDHTVSHEMFDIAQCQDCSFTYTQNAPDESVIGKYYESEEYISHSNTQKGLVNRLYHKARTYMLGQKMRVLTRRGIVKSSRILDYGCGTGYFVNHLNQQGYASVGMEISENARKFAISQFNLKIHHPDTLFDVSHDPFDAITLWHVLEHLYDPARYLNRFHELLTDKGLLIIAVPNNTSYDANHYGKFWAAWDTPRHLWHFTPVTLTKWAEKTGFTVEKMIRMPLDVFYVSLLSEKYQGKQGLSQLFGGGISGLRSWSRSLTDARKTSSIIYVLKKR